MTSVKVRKYALIVIIKRVPNYLCIFQNNFSSAKISLFIKYCGRYKIIIKKSQLLRIKKQV